MHQRDVFTLHATSLHGIVYGWNSLTDVFCSHCPPSRKGGDGPRGCDHSPVSTGLLSDGFGDQ